MFIVILCLVSVYYLLLSNNCSKNDFFEPFRIHVVLQLHFIPLVSDNDCFDFDFPDLSRWQQKY